MAEESTSTLLLVLDLSGIFVFAISGALVGVRKQLDVFGLLVLAGMNGSWSSSTPPGWGCSASPVR